MNALESNLRWFSAKPALVLIALLLAGCGATNANYRPELEPFPRSADYDYALPNLAGATNYTVTLSAEGFVWPRVARDADTAFVEIYLHVSSGENPAIAFEANGKEGVQFFEEDGSGRRYLDVSPLLQAGVTAGSRVSLRGSGASWRSGAVSLSTFSNAIDEQERVLVVAPHPDDAEIAAYGIYENTAADVVTITAGDAGGTNFDALWPNTAEHFRAKGRIRTLDSLTVPLLGGLRHTAIRNLGYYDATLRSLYQQRPRPVAPPLAVIEEPGYYRRLNFDEELRDRAFESSWQNLVADLLQELERVQPGTIVAPHPFLDRHGDHQYAAIALFEALEQWGRESKVLLYTNHAVGNEAYPLGPKEGMTGLPAWNEGELHLTGLYSHPLSQESQRGKLVALEAMHDLRPFDLRDGDEVDTISALYDYFRRAPRPNETYFVTDLEGTKAIREQFLAQ